ncbi:MAG TPA: sulfite exporter TauE/SafE family protein, partial [Paracoccus sp. (in: a-proteobacteria)]|nr:sulfite exporter TauE/SafE family protein [Paracoccus sp. (in: a-proteobacteria)]
MSAEVFALLAAVVLISSFVQGSIGIGFALIMAPLVGTLVPSLLPVTLLLLMLPLNFLVAWRERHAVDWPGVRWMTLGRLPGTVAGVWILAVMTAVQLDFTVGLFTVIAAAVALIAPRFDPNRPAAFSVGAFTGITETATGIGGP